MYPHSKHVNGSPSIACVTSHLQSCGTLPPYCCWCDFTLIRCDSHNLVEPYCHWVTLLVWLHTGCLGVENPLIFFYSLYFFKLCCNLQVYSISITWRVPPGIISLCVGGSKVPVVTVNAIQHCAQNGGHVFIFPFDLWYMPWSQYFKVLMYCFTQPQLSLTRAFSRGNWF